MAYKVIEAGFPPGFFLRLPIIMRNSLYTRLSESLKRDLLGKAKAGEPRPKANTVHGIALAIMADGLKVTGKVEEKLDKALWKELLTKVKAGEELDETFDIAAEIFAERVREQEAA